MNNFCLRRKRSAFLSALFVFLFVKYSCLPESGLCINARIITEKASHQNEYDDSIVRQMVECIKVYTDKCIEAISGDEYVA